MKVKADPEVERVYENAAAIHAVSSPLLIIQGRLDDVVSIEQSREVLASSPGAQKQFVEVPIAHHNDLRFTQPPASDAVEQFVRSLR